MKLRSTITIIFLIVAAIACQSTATPISPATVSLESQVQTAAAGIALTQTALAQIQEPTQMPVVVDTPIPPTSAVVPDGNHFAWNFLATQESGGIKIEIARFVLADKTTIPEMDFSLVSSFDDKPIVGEIVFRITNNTQQTLSVYPDQGTVIVGGEQIELSEYMMLATFGDSVGGDIFPGVTKIGGIWFGIKRTSIADIQNITLAFGGPSDANFSSMGADYNFTIDLSNRQDQPLPDELK
jgi:archaellum component FlaG (FlaF/FlaG flagellin family)